jgi:hypothetical protein
LSKKYYKLQQRALPLSVKKKMEKAIASHLKKKLD